MMRLLFTRRFNIVDGVAIAVFPMAFESSHVFGIIGMWIALTFISVIGEDFMRQDGRSK